MLPQKNFWNLEAMKLLLGHIYKYSWPNTMLLRGQMIVSHVWISILSMMLIGDTKQATSQGESGPVET